MSSVKDFIQLLSTYQHDSAQPDALILQVRATRLSLRDDPAQNELYGQDVEIWKILATVFSNHVELLVKDDQTVILSLTTLASMTASLCSSPHAQTQAMKFIEPQLRSILHYSSALMLLENEKYTALTRSCCQALSNMILYNAEMADYYLSSKLCIEGSDSLLSRVLASSDIQTLQAVLVIVLSLIYNSPSRALEFSTSKPGAFLIDRILVLVEAFFDVNDPTGEVSDVLYEGIFDIAFSIVQELIKTNCFPQAYTQQQSVLKEYLICSSQVLLLKFLDGYLQIDSVASTLPSSSLIEFILTTFSTLAKGLKVIDRPKDTRDAATFQGLVLILHCIITIGLGTDEGRTRLLSTVEEISNLIAISNELIPKPAISTLEEEEQSLEPQAIGQLKLSCVRLLGILAFDSKDAQDRIRESGGLTLLLGLCQINDKNPTLREHALFAIRNTLKYNQVNQDLVNGIKPLYLVGDDGALKDLPPAMR